MGLLAIVLKSWLLVALIAAFIASAVAYYITRQTPIYRAEMSLKIEPNAMRPLGTDIQPPGESNNSYWSNVEYFETQFRLLSSRTLAERVVQTLQLHRDLHFLAGLPQQAPVPADIAPTTIEGAAGIVQRNLDVSPVKNSRLVELRYEDADPKRAQKILKAVADSYIERNLENSVTSIGHAAEWLNNQLSRLKQELEQNELALHEYKKDNHLLSVSLNDRTNMLGNEMSQLNDALVQAKASRQKLASRVTQLDRVTAEDPSDLPAGELLSSPALQELRSAFIAAKTQLNSVLTSGKGTNHPQVREATSAAEIARTALLAEVRNIQESARRNLAAVDQEIAGLNGLFGAAKAQAFNLNLREIEYKRLARARENAERLHSIVLERAKESELTQQMKFNNVSVVDAPLVPRQPVKPRVMLTIILGGIGGLGFGVFFVLIRARMDNKLREPLDIEEALGVTCLATVPAVAPEDGAPAGVNPVGRRGRRKAADAGATKGLELWAHYQPRSTAAEAVRTLRTNLAFMSPDHPHRTVLVTSAGPTDGKTTLATSLAITLAQSGHQVLLLDSDLRRPRLAGIFGLDGREQGLTRALLDPSRFMDNVKATQVEGLSLLTSGPIPPNPAELLHSENFKTLLNQAMERFDRIIIDSPPLMPVTDAAILSRLADTTLLVVRSGETRKDHARRALRTLADVNASVAGVVLNGHKARGSDGYYYHQYYGHTARSQEANA